MPDRPEFFELLGLAPPVTVDDVKQAYLSKVREVHPDRGGDAQQFIRLQDAFQQATEYATFRADRMKWLGVQAERYAAQQVLIEKIRALGGTAQVDSVAWMQRSFGEDFAQLMDRIVGITLQGPKVTDDTLHFLVSEQALLQQLRVLDLAGSHITDFGVLALRVFQDLRRLDLSNTPIGNDSLHLPERLLQLQWLGIRGTRITLVAKLKARFAHPRVTFG